ncbi:hypothetical protein GCM10010345_18710 [Streptomyces canarius]|uniref:Uncharacterized protein n=1 Tax=Streptomyces canarius TaxID=285453 RepID=A0ABQ3CJB2_9ACTN|nr:hypothetical protein GCM10010345_18710 [Streptomyces canarius]
MPSVGCPARVPVQGRPVPPSTRLPPVVGYRCQYAAEWVADKTRWALSVGTGERSALAEVLSQCPNVPVTVTVTRARCPPYEARPGGGATGCRSAARCCARHWPSAAHPAGDVVTERQGELLLGGGVAPGRRPDRARTPGGGQESGG